MKKIILICLAIVLMLDSIAQQKSAATSKPGGTSDLEVISIELTDASKDHVSGLHTIQVKLALRNGGSSASGNTTLKAVVQMPVLAVNQNAGSPPWLDFGSPVTLKPIAAGKSGTMNLTFKETRPTITAPNFKLVVMLDPANSLNDANRDNNHSTPIVVTPTVTTPAIVAAAPNSVKTTEKLLKVDTLVYTIGRADFSLGNSASTSAYIRTYPQGITVRKMGTALGESSSASLVAPIHLPAGAVIRQVVFNYIILPQANSVPHLVLRTHTLSSDGGIGINRPITSYWTSSNGLNGRNGYDVKSSATPSGFSVPILKGESYYFEILAGDSRSTSTPASSLWPDNEKIFIWSINVYYTQ